MCVTGGFLDAQYKCCGAAMVCSCISSLGLSLLNEALISNGHPIVEHTLSPSSEYYCHFYEEIRNVLRK